MRFGLMEAWNFLSIEEVSVDFSNRGLVLIQGDNQDSEAFESNGSGKSTVFSETIVWALYGITIRGKKADKVINRRVGKNTKVVLNILDEDDTYTIERYRKHHEHRNHVRLFRNGENITGKSDKDTDQMIIDLIQMDYVTFINSVMFGQGVSKMFASSTDAEQKKILETMLQIDIYKACQELAKKYVKDIDLQINGVQSQLDLHLNSQKTTKDMLEHAQEQEAQLEQKVNTRIMQLQVEHNTLEDELKDLPDLMSLQGEADEYKGLVEKLDDRIAGYKQHEDTYNDLLIESKSIAKEMSNLTKDMDKKRKELADIQSGKNLPKICSACGQDLPLEDTTHLENHIKDAIKEMGMDWQACKEDKEEVDKLVAKVQTVLDGKTELEEQRKELLRDVNVIEKDIISVVNREKSIQSTQKRILDQIEEQRKLLDTTYTESINYAIKILDELKEYISKEHDELDKLTAEKVRYEFWVNGYSNEGIKSLLLDSVTPFLNKRGNHYLNALADSSIEVEFSTQAEDSKGNKKDKFSVGVKNENGDDEYNGNSNGEKRRIDVAVNMALQDLVLSRSNKRLDLIVYDEVFEGLDSIGSERVIQLLQEKAQQCGTVMVITHNDSLKQLFTQSLVVCKQDGKTVIADGE